MTEKLKEEKKQCTAWQNKDIWKVLIEEKRIGGTVPMCCITKKEKKTRGFQQLQCWAKKKISNVNWEVA